jgi:hypothetical protein
MPRNGWTWSDVKPAGGGAEPAAEPGGVHDVAVASAAVAAPAEPGNVVASPPESPTPASWPSRPLPTKPSTAMLAAGMQVGGLGPEEVLRIWQAMVRAHADEDAAGPGPAA